MLEFDDNEYIGKMPSGGGGSTTATSVVNQNTNVGAISPLKVWNGTEQEWNTGGGSQTWYCWDSSNAGGTIDSYYLKSSSPQVGDVVYSAPNVATTYKITYVHGENARTSNGRILNYNSSGNQTTTISIGESHPDYLCFINGVGVKIGTTTIAQVNES